MTGTDEETRLRALLAAAREPAAEDPRLWTPPEVVALALQYAYAVEALPHAGLPAWAEAAELAEEVLFLRDMLGEWLDLFGPEALEELVDEVGGDVPLAADTDARLAELYRDHGRVRDFMRSEYARFRDDVAPPRRARWWWLDAELSGQLIH